MYRNSIDLHKLHLDFDVNLVSEQQPLQKSLSLDSKRISTRDVYEQACNITAWQQLYDQLYPGSFCGELYEVWLDGVQFFKESTSLNLRQSCLVWPEAVWFGIPKQKSRDSFVCSSRVEDCDVATFRGGHEFELLTPENLELMGFVISESELAQYFELTTEKNLEDVLALDASLKVDDDKKNDFWYFMDEALSVIENAPERIQHINAQKMLKDSLIIGMIELLDSAVPHKKARNSQLSYRRVISQARDYILGQPGKAVTILELCSYLHVSRRTLQNAFQNILGISPIQYLKAIRLNAVRRELLSQYSVHFTVQDAAMTWGFWHLSQFAADYHNLFNELPSETLAQRGIINRKVANF